MSGGEEGVGEWEWMRSEERSIHRIIKPYKKYI